MIHNFFTLSFTDQWEHLEPDFLDFHFKESLFRIRITILFIIFIYASFSILDAIIAPELKTIFWFIRFCIVCPVAGAVLCYSFRPGFHKYAQPSLFIMCLTGGVGIEAMIILAGPPASYSYYAGIILVFITIFTLLRMRFVWATSCACLIVACYEIGAIWCSTETKAAGLIQSLSPEKCSARNPRVNAPQVPSSGLKKRCG